MIVGIRTPRKELYESLCAMASDWERAGIASVTCIGDALAPGAIVHAVHSGHRYARELEAAPAAHIEFPAAATADAMPYLRDFPT